MRRFVLDITHLVIVAILVVIILIRIGIQFVKNRLTFETSEIVFFRARNKVARAGMTVTAKSGERFI